MVRLNISSTRFWKLTIVASALLASLSSTGFAGSESSRLFTASDFTALENGIDLGLTGKATVSVWTVDGPDWTLKSEGSTLTLKSASRKSSGAPAWKTIPSWFVYGSADKNIPAAALEWMAQRAGSKETVVVKGASHVVMVSHPGTVAKLIEQAARAVGN